MTEPKRKNIPINAVYHDYIKATKERLQQYRRDRGDMTAKPQLQDVAYLGAQELNRLMDAGEL